MAVKGKTSGRSSDMPGIDRPPLTAILKRAVGGLSERKWRVVVILSVSLDGALFLLHPLFHSLAFPGAWYQCCERDGRNFPVLYTALSR